VLLRDGLEDYPFDEIGTLFEQQGIAVHFFGGDDAPPGGIDMVIAMGGDGTVLRALDLLPQCPVVAINFGKIGFLTAGDRSDLKAIISRLVAGDFLISERLMLACEHPWGATRVINEIDIRTRHRLIFTDVFVNDTKIRTIRGDGVVVGTSTGSTGFLLSTGAPIVMPEVRCMILDGINEFNFSSRALILAPDSHIRLHISAETRDPSIYCTADGRELGQLVPGQELFIRRAENPAKLVFFDENYFFHNLSSKLSWD
jgi:NAD+ kinase